MWRWQRLALAYARCSEEALLEFGADAAGGADDAGVVGQ